MLFAFLTGCHLKTKLLICQKFYKMDEINLSYNYRCLSKCIGFPIYLRRNEQSCEEEDQIVARVVKICYDNVKKELKLVIEFDLHFVQSWEELNKLIKTKLVQSNNDYKREFFRYSHFYYLNDQQIKVALNKYLVSGWSNGKAKVNHVQHYIPQPESGYIFNDYYYQNELKHVVNHADKLLPLSKKLKNEILHPAIPKSKPEDQFKMKIKKKNVPISTTQKQAFDIWGEIWVVNEICTIPTLNEIDTLLMPSCEILPLLVPPILSLNESTQGETEAIYQNLIKPPIPENNQLSLSLSVPTPSGKNESVQQVVARLPPDFNFEKIQFPTCDSHSLPSRSDHQFCFDTFTDAVKIASELLSAVDQMRTQNQKKILLENKKVPLSHLNDSYPCSQCKEMVSIKGHNDLLDYQMGNLNADNYSHILSELKGFFCNGCNTTLCWKCLFHYLSTWVHTYIHAIPSLSIHISCVNTNCTCHIPSCFVEALFQYEETKFYEKNELVKTAIQTALNNMTCFSFHIMRPYQCILPYQIPLSDEFVMISYKLFNRLTECPPFIPIQYGYLPSWIQSKKCHLNYDMLVFILQNPNVDSIQDHERVNQGLQALEEMLYNFIQNASCKKCPLCLHTIYNLNSQMMTTCTNCDSLVCFMCEKVFCDDHVYKCMKENQMAEYSILTQHCQNHWIQKDELKTPFSIPFDTPWKSQRCPLNVEFILKMKDSTSQQMITNLDEEIGTFFFTSLHAEYESEEIKKCYEFLFQRKWQRCFSYFATHISSSWRKKLKSFIESNHQELTCSNFEDMPQEKKLFRESMINSGYIANFLIEWLSIEI